MTQRVNHQAGLKSHRASRETLQGVSPVILLGAVLPWSYLESPHLGLYSWGGPPSFHALHFLRALRVLTGLCDLNSMAVDTTTRPSRSSWG